MDRFEIARGFSKKPSIQVPVSSSFVMRDFDPDSINKYDCSSCKAKGISHRVINVPGSPTDRWSCWGSGLPTTMRRCTGCGFEDGPWVSTELVGDGW